MNLNLAGSHNFFKGRCLSLQLPLFSSLLLLTYFHFLQQSKLLILFSAWNAFAITSFSSSELEGDFEVCSWSRLEKRYNFFLLLVHERAFSRNRRRDETGMMIKEKWKDERLLYADHHQDYTRERIRRRGWKATTERLEEKEKEVDFLFHQENAFTETRDGWVGCNQKL